MVFVNQLKSYVRIDERLRTSMWVNHYVINHYYNVGKSIKYLGNYKYSIKLIK